MQDSSDGLAYDNECSSPIVGVDWHNGVIQHLDNHPRHVSLCDCRPHHSHHEWKKDQSTHMSASLVSLQSVDSFAVRCNQSDIISLITTSGFKSSHVTITLGDELSKLLFNNILTVHQLKC